MRATPVLALPAAVVVALALAAAAPAHADPVSPANSASSTDAHPVDPSIVSLPLAGVDPAAARAVKAAASSTHGAPDATATLARKDAAILTAPTSTTAFQTIGVTWRPASSPPDLLISVRTKHQTKHQNTSTWTGWTPLDTDDDDATQDPVVATGLTAAAAAKRGLRAGTSSLWVGPSQGVQVRVVVRSGTLPLDLKAELIDPGTSAADATATPGQPGATRAVTTASMDEPAIYSRRAWGADESRVRNSPTYMSTIKAAVVHHTAGPNNYSRAQVPGIIRGDYAYHLSRGWSDIGYNALVDRFGRIWEGRAGGIDKAVMGAHAGGFNAYTFGVSVIGNYDTARPSAASIEAVARVIAWKLDLNHRYPAGSTDLTSAGGGTARYKAGRTVTLPVIMGHRNTGFTACPGKYLYPYLPRIRARVTTLMKAALTNPSSSPAVTTLGTPALGTPAWISARALFAQSWQLTVTAGCNHAIVHQGSGTVAAGQSFRATWDGKLSDGTLALPGQYTLQLTAQSRTGVARPVTSTVLIQPPFNPDPPTTDPPTTDPSTGAGGYTPVTPARLTDVQGHSTLAVYPLGRVDVPVLGRAGVPASGVTSVVLNVTVTCATSGTSLTVWPTGDTTTRTPVTSVDAGSSRSVLVTSPVGANGSVSIVNGTGVAQLTADVVGYYSASGSKITAVPTTRILDTTTGTPLAAGQARAVTLPASIGGVPSANISAVVADLSAIAPTGNGTLSAYPAGAGSLPAALVFRTGVSVDNLVIVPVTAGAFWVKTAGGSAQATVDVRGVVTSDGTGANLTAIAPAPVFTGTITAGTVQVITVTGGTTGVPAGVSGVLIGLNATAPTATGSFEIYQTGVNPGSGTAMRVRRGESRGTVMLVPVGPGGSVTLKLGAGRSPVQVSVRGYLS